MSSKPSPTHCSNRRNMCAVCLSYFGPRSNKKTYMMNEELAAQLQKLFPEYSHDSQCFPCGLCNGCYKALARMKSGEQDTISSFKHYEPAAINVKEGATDCNCFMCRKPHQPFQFTKEQQPVRSNGGKFVKQEPDLSRCDKCLSLKFPGGHKECTKAKTLENVLNLDPDLLEHVVAEFLRRKESDEIKLRHYTGGQPMTVHVGHKPVSEGPQILTHEEINVLQKDLPLSINQTRQLLTMWRLKNGKNSVQPYWNEVHIEEIAENEDLFDLEHCTEFQDNKGRPLTRPLCFTKDAHELLLRTAVLRGYTDAKSLTLKVTCDSGKGGV